MNSLERRRFQTQVSLFVFLWSNAGLAAVIGAMGWLAAHDVGVRNAAPPILVIMIMVGVVTAAIGTCLAWMMASRWFPAATATPIEAPAPSFQPHEEVVLAPTPWRAVLKDPLTGLFNRDALLAFVDDAVPYFRRYKRGVSVLVVEIDYLNGVADTVHAEAAEQALRHVADVLDLSVRKTDKVASFGPNRFVVLLREISEADTLALANRIRDSVAALCMTQGDQKRRVTVSIGAAIVAESDRRGETLIERAETALGAAKADGGNRVAFQAAVSIAALENVA